MLVVSRFTKRHFVWHKNTQKLEEAYLIQFLLLSLNMNSVFKFLQRPPNGSQFSFFSKNFTHNFLFIFKLSSNCRKFRLITQPYVRRFCFYLLENSRLCFSLTGRCGAKVTQNEKWRPFGGRWIKKTKTNIVEFSEKSWIRQAASSFWGFLCRTNFVFMNRVCIHAVSFIRNAL